MVAMGVAIRMESSLGSRRCGKQEVRGQGEEAQRGPVAAVRFPGRRVALLPPACQSLGPACAA